MLHRGSTTSDLSPAFKLTNVNPFDINGEIKALAHTLTTLKTNVEDIFTVHKHANNKHDHQDDPNLNSYDPSVIIYTNISLEKIVYPSVLSAAVHPFNDKKSSYHKMLLNKVDMLALAGKYAFKFNNEPYCLHSC